MRLGVAATPDVAIPTLDWLLKTEHQIGVVITQPDKPAGRGRSLKQTIVADWADRHKIEVVKPQSPLDLVRHLEGLDCVITIGYGVLLPQSILDIPKHGFLNLHFSLLPAYRGAAPAQRALLNGETVTGVTVFKLEKGMDTGPIFSQLSIKIENHWRSVELLSELAHQGPNAVSTALSMIEQGIAPIPQSGTPTFAPKISKEQARLYFSHDAESIVNAVRAFTYEPGAWCLWNNESFKITSASVDGNNKVAEGQIFVNEKRVFVGCGDNSAIEILTVVPAGKREMPAIDWARGARLLGGEKFG